MRNRQSRVQCFLSYLIVLVAMTVGGCLPSLDSGCGGDADCPSGQVCQGGLCLANDLDMTVEGDVGLVDAEDVLDQKVDDGVLDGGRIDAGSDQDACVVSGSEVCDRIDNDCNGTVDDVPVESCLEVIDDCAYRGVSTCESGTELCINLAGDPEISDEMCDGVDNDCNGTVDDIVELPCDVPDAMGQCAIGTIACRSNSLICMPRYVAVPEICNGLDDDCNGDIDDNPASVGDVCQSGVGLCASVGQYQCVRDVLWCNAEPGQPEEEICDGLDNDCDGMVDDVRALECTTDQLGACSYGQMLCVGGRPTECQPLVSAIDERCGDGIDNDCDGETDEDFVYGAACHMGLGACRRDGITICDDGIMVCSVNPGEPSGEECNGVDDDCDDDIDDDIDDGGVCNTGRLGACAEGVLTCVDGRMECVSSYEPISEICNGMDDDCDGEADEDYAKMGLGSVCVAGSGLCLAEGHNVCTADGLNVQCDAVSDVSHEICNMRDDDCDGLVDEEKQGVVQVVPVLVDADVPPVFSTYNDRPVMAYSIDDNLMVWTEMSGAISLNLGEVKAIKMASFSSGNVPWLAVGCVHGEEGSLTISLISDLARPTVSVSHIERAGVTKLDMVPRAGGVDVAYFIQRNTGTDLNVGTASPAGYTMWPVRSLVRGDHVSLARVDNRMLVAWSGLLADSLVGEVYVDLFDMQGRPIWVGPSLLEDRLGVAEVAIAPVMEHAVDSEGNPIIGVAVYNNGRGVLKARSLSVTGRPDAYNELGAYGYKLGIVPMRGGPGVVYEQTNAVGQRQTWFLRLDNFGGVQSRQALLAEGASTLPGLASNGTFLASCVLPNQTVQLVQGPIACALR